MEFSFSRFGNKLAGESGIFQLMQDLNQALNSSDDMLFLGGGNPAQIPGVSEIFRKAATEMVADPVHWQQVAGVYDSSQGSMEFIENLAAFLRRNYHWPVQAENIALTNGSQNSFFLLFNLFAGRAADQSLRKILLPMVPEYIGYADAGIDENIFTSYRPRIDVLDDIFFKYKIDFNAIDWAGNLGLACVSRPTNPTGNVITDQELNKLAELTAEHNLPLLVDNAYGLPFPKVVFTDLSLPWAENIIHIMSLSKLGLPASRCGIVVAHPQVIEALTRMNAIINLATGSFGPAVLNQLLVNDQLLQICSEMIQPFYRQKSLHAIDVFQKQMNKGVDFRIHKSEGAFFIWVWFRNLAIPTLELYQRLKKRRVLVVPGEYYFPGLNDKWSHTSQCIRVSFAQPEQVVEEGIKIICEEVAANLQ